MFDAANVTDLATKEFCGTAPFTVHAFTMFTVWTVRNSTKISGNFFLLPIQNPITIYLGHVHVNMNIKFVTEITGQTNVHAK